MTHIIHTHTHSQYTQCTQILTHKGSFFPPPLPKLQYLTELGCPHTEAPWESDEDARVSMLDWLLGYAVALEYSDDRALRRRTPSTSSTAKPNARPAEPRAPLSPASNSGHVQRRRPAGARRRWRSAAVHRR